MNNMSLNPLNKSFKNEILKKALENHNENYRIALRDFLEYCGSDDITLDKITGFKTECEKKYKSSTVALKVKAVKSILRKTMFQDPTVSQGQRFQLEQALKDIKTVSQNARAKDIKSLSREEVRMLLECCQSDRALFLIKVILLNGCRIGEAIQLDRKKLKPAGSGMLIQDDIIGKGNKRIRLRITQDLLDFARPSWGNETSLVMEVKRGSASALVRWNMRKVLLQEVSAHTLRHTYATLALEEGLSLQEVAVRLNHSTPDVTARFYLHGQTTETGDSFSRKLIE